MDREDYVRSLIKKKGYSVKSFAQEIHIPYTTLLGMLKSGLGSACVENVFRIFHGLNICIADLEKAAESLEEPAGFQISEHEKQMILKYRIHCEMQAAVDKLLENGTAPSEKK